jgi:signal peptidase
MKREPSMNLQFTRRTAANLLVFVVVVAVVAPFVVYAVPSLVEGDASYIVLTGSMEPAISPNDAVIVGTVTPADIEVGDVITYTRPGLEVPVTHRVVDIVDTESGTAFRTMGDANEDPDLQLVPADNVAGEVILVIPYIGYVVEFVGTPVGFAALVVVPIALLIASEVWTFAARRRDAKATDIDGEDPLALTSSTVSGDTGHGVLIGAAGFGVAALYAGWLAAGDASPVNVTVAAGAGVVAVFLAYLWTTGTSQNGPVVVEGRVSGVEGTAEVRVDSPAALATLADGRVIVDRLEDRYLAFGAGVVYTTPIPEPVLEEPIPAVRRVADPDAEPVVKPAVRRISNGLDAPRPAVRRVDRPVNPVTDGGAMEADDVR